MATAKKATSKKKASAKKASVRERVGSPSKTAAKKPYRDNTADNTKPPRMRPPDAIDLLADDHLAAGKVFKQYEKLAKKSGSPTQRKALASKVCAMLTVHTAIEEEIFYPAARAAGLEDDMMNEALIEHASAKELIAQIREGQPGQDYFDAKVKVLSDYIEHHVIEEHTEMFPKCRRSRMDLTALRVAMSARKKQLEKGG